MTTPLHSTLVALTLLSQLLGSVAVLCVEADGRLCVEFGIGDCCGLGESGEPSDTSSDETDECGSCQDLTLSLGDRGDRDQDDGEVARSFVLELELARVRCCVLSCPEPAAPAHRSAPCEAPDIAELVSATVVLTC